MLFKNENSKLNPPEGILQIRPTGNSDVNLPT